MWSSYSARHAAQLIGLPESAVRSCVRAGLIGGQDLPVRLSFRDLSALRTVKSVVGAGIPLARARRELVEIQRQLPPGASLAEIPIEVRDGHLWVRGEPAPLAGQLPLPFAPYLASGSAPALTVPAGQLHDLPSRPIEALTPAPALTAEDWFERAIALEDGDATATIDAYRRSLRLRPDCVEAWINLGRLHAEGAQGEAATECFSTALRLDPRDATAVYNLGVVPTASSASAAPTAGSIGWSPSPARAARSARPAAVAAWPTSPRTSSIESCPPRPTGSGGCPCRGGCARSWPAIAGSCRARSAASCAPSSAGNAPRPGPAASSARPPAP